MTKNTVKEKPKTEAQPKQKSNGGNIVTRSVGNVLSGAFLSRERAIRAIPFIFFLTLVQRLKQDVGCLRQVIVAKRRGFPARGPP